MRSPEAWRPQAKLKTPEGWFLQRARVRIGDAILAAAAMPGPASWASACRQRRRPRLARRAEEWLGPDAVWKRLEWATRVASVWGGRSMHAAWPADPARSVAGDTSRVQIRRAADGPQALALLLMAPEFQRR